MKVSGEYRLARRRQAVWDALLDPDVLRRCIPGCEELSRLDAEQYGARVRMAIGPVTATFNARLRITNANPPSRYRLQGEGQGGAIGFGRGHAEVTLMEEGGGTVLSYAAEFQVGGRIAQLGSRLLSGTTQKLADDFFARLAADIDAASERLAPVTAPAPSPGRRRTIIAIAVLSVLVVAGGLLWWLRSA